MLRRYGIEWAAKATQRLVQQTPSQCDRLGVFLILQIVTNITARLACHHEAQPGGIGLRARRGDDFHGLATLQGFTQGGEPSTYATCHAGIADIGMNRVGKVHGGGSGRQFNNRTLGSKNIDFVGE